MSDARALTRAAMILTVVATGLGRLLIGDAYRSYVRSSMFVPILVSAVAIAGLALWTAFGFDDVDDEHEPDDDHHGHDHGAGGLPKVAWWLLVPFACIAIVPLRPLGSSSVREGGANQAVAQRVEQSGAATDGPGPAEDGTMTLLDFVSQAVNEPDRPVEGDVRLTGFVHATGADGFVLGRFVMSCCAADAVPMLVTVQWDGELPAVDGWVTVVGRHQPAPADTPPERRIEAENIVVDAGEVIEIDAPADPYETY